LVWRFSTVSGKRRGVGTKGCVVKKVLQTPGNALADELDRFALTGHQWQLESTKANSNQVIRKCGRTVLVRLERNASATPRRLTFNALAAIKSELDQACRVFEMKERNVPLLIPNDDRLRAFSCEARWLLFGNVLARAREGDGLAIKEIAVMAVEITKLLTELRSNTRTLPTIKAVARDMFEWPHLLGATKQFSENPQGVVENIELGGGRVSNTGSRADWRDAAAGHIAQALLMHKTAPRSWEAAKKLLDAYPPKCLEVLSGCSLDRKDS
jgi:hypothetical protein